MIISKYTILLSRDNIYLAYNSLSNTLIEIDNLLFNLLEAKKNNKESVSEKEFESSIIYHQLIERNIITENDNDDYLLYNAQLKRNRLIHNKLFLTIAPTLNCNFSCSYCFEGKRKGIMKSETIENLLYFIRIHKEVREIDITWFGGEPLMAPTVINTISKRISEISGIKFTSRVITNGYFLNSKVLTILRGANVTSIQLSIDGLGEVHNRVKFTNKDKDTFSTIIENIDNFSKSEFKINLGIRVNIDKTNMDEFIKVYSFFQNRYSKNKNIQLMPSFIIGTSRNACAENCLLNENDKFEFLKELAIITKQSSFIYPTPMKSECAIRNQNSWTIDSNGDIYKCWEIIGNTDYKIGHLTKNGLKITNQKLLNRYLFGADPLEDHKCISCNILPICGGGCPHKRIENVFNDNDYNHCSHFKNNINDYLIARSNLNK